MSYVTLAESKSPSPWSDGRCVVCRMSLSLSDIQFSRYYGGLAELIGGYSGN